MKRLVNAVAGAVFARAGPKHWLYSPDFLVVIKTSQKQFCDRELIVHENKHIS